MRQLLECILPELRNQFSAVKLSSLQSKIGRQGESTGKKNGRYDAEGVSQRLRCHNDSGKHEGPQEIVCKSTFLMHSLPSCGQALRLHKSLC